jgi:hypothetical protein
MTIESAVRTRSGKKTGVHGWGIVDEYVIEGRHIAVRLSEAVAREVRSNGATLMDGPTLRSIAHKDLIAMRLWTFLEAETLHRIWQYRVFGHEDRDPADHSLPPLADLLRLHGKPSQVIDRLRHAIGVIVECDPGYDVLALGPSASGRGWILYARKVRANGAATSGRRTSLKRANDGLICDHPAVHRRSTVEILTVEKPAYGRRPERVADLAARYVAKLVENSRP